MAGGSLTVTMDINSQAPAVAQRILCQLTNGNKQYLRTDTGRGSAIAFVLPEERFPANILLKRGGTDLLAGYVAGTNITYHVSNGNAIEQNVNTCPSSASQPTTTAPVFVTNVGGVPLATTLTYANLGGAGTVNINWGDQTSTLGAAESGSANHTYPNNGVYTITITDASDATAVASMVVHVP
jgi:hypothetical protein